MSNTKLINTQIIINATPDKVWSVLTDFENYSNWNPFIKNIIGEPKVGSRITVSIALQEGNLTTFKPTVVAFEQNKELRWFGKLFFKGVFYGEHKFELIDNGNGITIFNHSETFNGILVRLFKKQLENNIKKNFELMNKSLKKRVEIQMK
ncbi:polyketide cyclase [Flavobacterium sp. Root935]|uniref:SRPBCC domain-containing protein n=1 Tax=Flavobacterium sp. Root935 TaxID=1736610 RepID=UPI00070BF7C1|nr:SRPBCC domain-containing protein [Flavobacterium sp. Root935]KRD58747.1 polyketide cyclase [Flavobacterium sp. Root935]